MPQIKEYGAPKTQINNPIDTRRLTGESISLGVGISAVGQAVSNGENMYLDQMEKNNKQTTAKENARTSGFLSGTQLEFSQKQIDRLKAGPTDAENPEFDLNDHLAEYDQKTEEYAGTLTTEESKAHFREQTTKIRTNLAQDYMMGEAQLQGEKVKNDYNTTLANSAATLIGNPTSFEVTRENVASLVKSFVETGKISSVQGEELTQKSNQHLGSAAVKGLARINPDLAMKELDSGKWDEYLGANKDSLYGEVRTEERAKRVEEDRLKSVQEKATKEVARASHNELIKKKEDGSLTVNDILNSPIDPSTKNTMLNALHRDSILPSTLKTNPEKFTNLISRIQAPEGDPTRISSEEQINAEFRAGGLSWSDVGILRKELHKGETEEGKIEHAIKSKSSQAIKDSIYRAAGPKDPNAPELNLQAQRAYEKYYEEGIKNGKSPQELNDPKKVMEVARPFIRTPQEKLKATAVQLKKIKVDAGANSKQKTMERLQDILKKKGLRK
jgi:hypothetical protein